MKTNLKFQKDGNYRIKLLGNLRLIHLIYREIEPVLALYDGRYAKMGSEE